LHNFAQREVDIRFSAEMDEFWSFVQTKGNQRWTWYAIERRTGIIRGFYVTKIRKQAEFWAGNLRNA
jgi:IS1 family transposase